MEQDRSSERPRRQALPKDSSGQTTVKQTIDLLPACYGENARRGSLSVKQPSGRSESFLSRRRPDRPRAGLRKAAQRSRSAPPGAKAVPPGVQGDERFPRAVPVKQQSSKQSVYFQRVAAKTPAADHCQSNNRQAKTKAFLSRRRSDRPQAGLAEGRRMSAPCSAWNRTVPLNAQGDEHFPRTVPVKQQSSIKSVYFQTVMTEQYAADHRQQTIAVTRNDVFRRKGPQRRQGWRFSGNFIKSGPKGKIVSVSRTRFRICNNNEASFHYIAEYPRNHRCIFSSDSEAGT